MGSLCWKHCNQSQDSIFCVRPITGLEKCQGERGREGEIIDIKKAPQNNCLVSNIFYQIDEVEHWDEFAFPAQYRHM